MIAAPVRGQVLLLSGALGDLARLPGPDTAKEAIERVRAVLLAEGDPGSKLVVIMAAALEGVIADEREIALSGNVVPLPLRPREER